MTPAGSNSTNPIDLVFMRRALELAARARGLTSPNPLVGAVVVGVDGTVVAEGFHRAAGQPHAEVEALDAAGDRARRTTLYVTLEPCVHQGRTPPCAPRVIASGVARVVVAAGDPNPVVGGRGIVALRAAGLEVTTGVLEAEAQAQNRAFVTAMRTGRPHVTLKGAITLDGRIADTDRASRWITSEPARAHAHRLRSEMDAIVVGIETVLQDHPRLTVRLPEPWPREPYRVVIDSRARIPVDAPVIVGATPARAVIAIGSAAPADRVAALTSRGATVIHCPAADGRVDLAAVLRWLADREVRAVLVEGGGEMHAAFVQAGFVDRVAVFVAPLLLGGQTAPSLVGGPGRKLKDALRLGAFEVTSLGPDVLLEADVAISAA
jgi:diaminohydroxyphosphoribosylaminopyrimidine deaminase/5-amino-6-(5-phosphoribosylamino)uracil reductase